MDSEAIPIGSQKIVDKRCLQNRLVWCAFEDEHSVKYGGLYGIVFIFNLNVLFQPLEIHLTDLNCIDCSVRCQELALFGKEVSYLLLALSLAQLVSIADESAEAILVADHLRQNQRSVLSLIHNAVKCLNDLVSRSLEDYVDVTLGNEYLG